ncbi:MAG: VCBS repeat-containing protein [Gammaproteobacteria bacterium]|nr:VCBS repeat-containing protein [Gammaproteobacteria bacterium]
MKLHEKVNSAIGVLVSMILVWQAAMAQAPDISMSRDDTVIGWSGGGPLDASYKDVQVARDPDGALLLYLPVTRAMAGDRFDTIYIWDAGAGEFVDQSATLLPFINPAIDRGTYDVDFVDIDRDGDHDIVHSSPHGNRVYVNRRNEAVASFTDETNERLPAFMTADFANIWDDVTSGDVDGDGDLDLMFSNRNHPVHSDLEANWGPNVLAYNDSTGHFGLTEETRELYGQPATLGDGSTKLEGSSHGAKFADLNNDGRMDMIISHESNYEFGGGSAPDYEIMLNLGDPDADGKVNWSTTPVTQNGKIINLGIFDYDNDGNLDLYLARGGSNDEILTGNGDGTFDAPVEVQSLAGGENALSYDVAFGDFNNDAQMDIVTVDADGGSTTNLLYLNDRNNPDPGDPRLLVSNSAEFDPAAAPYSMLSAQPVDYDGDGDLDVILGAESRSAGREPLAIRNDLNATDGHPPVLEHSSLTLAASATPSALFRVRIRDRVIDFDEIDAEIQWSTTGTNGGAANGTSALRWGAQMTYQALLSCANLRGGSFAPEEAISAINWTVTANDSVPANTATLVSGDPGVGDALTQLQDSVSASGIGLNIIEPINGGAAPVVRDDGTDKLLIRLTVSPTNLIPNLDEFSVLINGDAATVLSVQKVGDQVWLAVQPPAGPGGVHDLQVDYSVCGLDPVSDVETNAVAYDDNPDDVDTVLVIDLSGSMNRDDKLAAAVNAGALFVNTLRDQDKVGVVQYSGSSSAGATSSFSLAPADSAGRSGALAALNGLAASGCTPLGAGLEQGLAELGNLGGLTANPSRSLVLLSDGLENIQPFWDVTPGYKCSADPVGPSVSNLFNALNTNADPDDDVRVDTVALGPNASMSLMSTIALATGGTPRQVLDTAGTLVSVAQAPLFSLLESAYAQPTAGNLANTLADIYENFHNGITGQQRLWRTIDSTAPRRIKRSELGIGGDDNFAARAIDALDDSTFTGRIIEVEVPRNISYATISANWATPRELTATIIPPADQHAGDVAVSRASTNAVFRITDPSPGVWRIVLSTEQNFDVLALLSGVSNVEAFARVLAPTESGKIANLRFARPAVFAAGDPVPFALMLVGSEPVVGAKVTGQASSSGNGQEPIEMTDDGQGMDQAANDGIYTGTLTQTTLGGTIDVTIDSIWQEANGIQMRSTPLTIEVAERDSDGDSLSDVIETLFRLDPTDPTDAFVDHDSDGLPTWKEIIYSLDPYNRDTDGGGVPDGKEVASLTDPEDGSDDEQARLDDDGDGMPNGWEAAYGLAPNDPNDAGQDLDSDGLSNLEEFGAGPAPNAYDTDRDGKNDGDEVAAGTDPTDPDNRADGVVLDPPAPGDVEPANELHNLLLVICIILLALVLLLMIVFLQRRRN